MIPKTSKSPEMVDSEGARSSDSKDKSQRNRSGNPWPLPEKVEKEEKIVGGWFGSSNAAGDSNIVRAFGSSSRTGGWGGSRSFANSTMGDSTFGEDNVPLGFNQTNRPTGFNGTGSGFKFGATPPQSTEKENGGTRQSSAMESTSRRGLFDNSGRSPSSRKSRAPRKQQRRSNNNNGLSRASGHCYHCGEQGHISRSCPKKSANDNDEEALSPFSKIQSQMSKPDYVDEITERLPLPIPSRKISLEAKHSESTIALETAKLQNLKARENYYSAYSYGQNDTNNNNSSMQTVVRAAKPPDVDTLSNFSKELDNALKLSTPSVPVTPTRRRENSVNQKVSTPIREPVIVEKVEPQEKPAAKAVGKEKRASSPYETLTIETSRRVMKGGECRFEEQTIISFPRNLPPNVRVIAAQFVPTAPGSS